MENIEFTTAANELLKMPGYCSSESIVLKKMTLPDGREAVLRMELTTEEDQLDCEVWTPN